MNYRIYRLKPVEMMEALCLYFLMTGAVAFFFYRSLIAFLILCPGVFFFLKYFGDRKKKERLKALKEEFSETLRCVGSGMNAGLSMENAFLSALDDIKLFYGENSLMAEEIIKIRKGLEVNIPLEESIKDLAVRSGDEDIAAFSDVLECAKRYGGNVTEVLRATSDGIRGKICVDKEIELLIAEKKLELRMMEVMPFFILIYLGVTSVGYFDVLYAGIPGRIFMTVCLAVYIAAIVLAEKTVLSGLSMGAHR
ncbi:MAG: type II secretion system F family protein [Lachnospiraceae bacterium]|nr:type II secretion system F family protein [Lachnospiraceae bacterium]